MQDLDLDELDQAVNKMMDKSSRGKRAPRPSVTPISRPEPAKPADDTSSVTPAIMGLPDPQKAFEAPAETAPRETESLHVPVNRPMPRVPERRRMHPGAMDIITPIAPKITAPSSRPGRMAADVQPTQEVKPEPPIAVTIPSPTPQEEFKPQEDNDIQHEVSDEVLASLTLFDEPKTDTKAPARAPQTEQKVAQAEPKKSDGWPDPLDFHDFGDKPTPSATPEVTTPEVTPVAPELPTEPELPKETPPTIEPEPVSVADKHDDAAQVASSPFVTTKVEKRPLGAFADAAQEPPKASLPDAEAHVPHEDTNKEDLASASLESKQHLAPQDEHDPTDLRSMTIPPQYHQSEQKPHDDIHHMYDTKEYHAAPQHLHTAHKSNPALVVGVVVLIVLIIAALAVAYLMMTGAFDVAALW